MIADWVQACDRLKIRDEVLPKLKKDITAFETGKVPSDLCVTIPKSYRPGGKVHSIIAEMLFGDDREDQMRELRNKLERKRKSNEKRNVKSNENIKENSKTVGKVKDQESRAEGCTKEPTDLPVTASGDLMARLQSRWNCRLDVLLTKMRTSIVNARDQKRRNAKIAPEPVQAVEQPEALPMDYYPEAEEFEDVIEFLKSGGAVAAEENLRSSVRFKHGNINNDGRLDLCKQGFRNAFTVTCEAVIKDGESLPTSIRFKYGTLNSDGRFDMCKQGFRKAFVKTCKAVESDQQDQQNQGTKRPLVIHYLIGNNRIAEDGDIPGEGNRRVAALARMIRHRPDIVTWYLAGNSMDHVHIKHVAEALEQSQSKYVWLKMNPVKTGAYYLGKMLMRTPSIELLDLFNCGLCNDGVEAFSRGLSDGSAEGRSSSHSNLRHLYLSINAIDSTQYMEQIFSFLPLLESLFIGVNPFGDKGFVQISDTIINKAPYRKVLKRLNISSMSLTELSLPLIEGIVKACPSLVSLELGSYRSTNYFGQKHNRFDVKKEATRSALEAIARALVHNAEISVDKHKGSGVLPMHYLGLQHALVVGACPADRTIPVSEAKTIIDKFARDQLHRGTGINVNGITNLFSSIDGKTYWHNGEWGGRGTPATNGVPPPNEVTATHDARATECTLTTEDALTSNDTSSCSSGANKNTCPSVLVGGGVFYYKGVTDDMRVRIKNPWPAIDHIKSIYRNCMKT